MTRNKFPELHPCMCIMVHECTIASPFRLTVPVFTHCTYSNFVSALDSLKLSQLLGSCKLTAKFLSPEVGTPEEGSQEEQPRQADPGDKLRLSQSKCTHAQ